jgi:hypothetical protein
MEFRTYRCHVRILALRFMNDDKTASVTPSAWLSICPFFRIILTLFHLICRMQPSGISFYISVDIKFQYLYYEEKTFYSYCHVFGSVTIDGVWIGELDLLTTCTHHSELQVITALSLISTIHRSSQHPLSPFPACCVFDRRSLATASNSGDPSASSPHVVTLWRISHNWTLANGQINYSTTSSQPELDSTASSQLTHQPTNSLHFTSLNWNAISRPWVLAI